MIYSRNVTYVELIIFAKILINGKIYLYYEGDIMSKIIDNIAMYFKKTDVIIWLLSIVAIGYSLLLISDMQRAGNYNYMFTQVIAIIIGYITAIMISLINYNFIVKLWWVFGFIGLLLSGLVFLFGVQVTGTDDTAWIQLPGGFSFQPSEFMKICFIITLDIVIRGFVDNAHNQSIRNLKINLCILYIGQTLFYLVNIT